MPYLGQLAEIPAGQGTLTSDNNPARSRFLDLIVAEGIYSEKGFWEREPGATPYTAGTLGSGTVSFTFGSARTRGAAAVYAAYTLSGTFNYIGVNTRFSGSSHLPDTVQMGVGGDPIASVVPSGAAVVIVVARTQSTAPPTGGAFSSITDTQGNTYTKVGSQLYNSNAAIVELWVATNVKQLTTSDNLTVTPRSTSDSLPYLVSVNVVTGLAALDTTNSGSANASAVSMTQPAALVPANATEALLIAYSDEDNGSLITAHPQSVVGSGNIAFGLSAQLFHSPFPLLTTAANALADYWVTTAVQRLLALGSDGVLYKSTGGPFVALTMATVMADDIGQIVIGGQEKTAGNPRKAFVFDNGHSRIQTLTGDGNSTTDFGNGWNTTTNIPVDWAVNPPRGGVIHKNRLWCWAPANAPHNIYASQLDNHENFKNAVGGQFEYVQALSEGVGLRIASCVSFKGMLFAFKYPRGILFLDDTDVDFTNWRWNPVTDSVGIADSPYAVIVLDDDILFVGPDGHLNFLSAVTQQGVASSDLTAALNLQQWVRENMNLARLGRMTSCYYPAKKQAFLGVSSLASSTNNLRILMDFSSADKEGQTVRIHYSHRDTNHSLAIRRESTTDGIQRPIFGDDFGQVWLMDQANKTVVGRPNVGQARYQYVRTDFSHIDPSLKNRRKLFDALTVVFKPAGNWTLSIDSVIDGRYQETLPFFMGGDASVLGSFILGTTPFGGGSITTERRRMTGSGYWLSLAGHVEGEAKDFSVASHIVNFRPGGEEQRGNAR